MRRRRAVPEAIGLSVLDLVCGLFGLLVVLYATTDRVDGSSGVLQLPLHFVRIQLADAFDTEMGMEIVVGGEIIRSWPGCIDAGPVTFAKCEDGIVEALIESEAGIDALRFLALTPPTQGGALSFGPMQVWVTMPEESRMCEIDFTTSFRGDFASTLQCPAS